MPATGAMPYQPVARTNPTRLPLPIDSPTLLTRRRYSRGSLVGFIKGGTLGPGPTTQVQPHPWPGEGASWVGFPAHPRSMTVPFQGGRYPNDDSGRDTVRMTIGVGENYLVTIAHRSTYPAPTPAINSGLWAARSRTQSAAPRVGPGRRYSLPYQFGFKQSDQVWPTSSQWLAGQMPGTS